jgi:hypothetical protein
MQASTANLEKLVDQVWTQNPDTATSLAFPDVSLARLGAVVSFLFTGKLTVEAHS